MQWANSPSLPGAIALRCDLVRSAEFTRRRAVLTGRIAIALVAALLILQITGMVWQMPWTAWMAEHRALLALVNILLTCFTAAYEWCAQRRLEDSEDALLAFVECRRTW